MDKSKEMFVNSRYCASVKNYGLVSGQRLCRSLEKSLGRWRKGRQARNLQGITKEEHQECCYCLRLFRPLFGILGPISDSSHCLSWASIVVIKHHNQKQPGGGAGNGFNSLIFQKSQASIQGSQGRNLGVGTETKAMKECCLVLQGLLILLSYSFQDYLLRSGTTFSELEPPLSIINQEKRATGLLSSQSHG